MSGKHIEIFKTTVKSHAMASQIRAELMAADPDSDVHFDLEDCDRILRIESPDLNIAAVMRIVIANGQECEVLEG